MRSLQHECGKMRTRITSNMDTFYAVSYELDLQKLFLHFLEEGVLTHLQLCMELKSYGTNFRPEITVTDLHNLMNLNDRQMEYIFKPFHSKF